MPRGRSQNVYNNQNIARRCTLIRKGTRKTHSKPVELNEQKVFCNENSKEIIVAFSGKLKFKTQKRVQCKHGQKNKLS